MNHSVADELLIARLFDLPATERPAYWERVCAENPGLRERSPSITRVLAAGGSPPTPPRPALLSADAMVGALESALSPMDQEAPGTRIGPYKLLQKIGEGGFGAVWMAEQLEPLRRRVALKIIKIGMDTEEVIARFEAERQALALMDHPNIARVFDAGATAAGRPFFVMELVRGVAITRYCDENRLTAEARLRLFIPVCQAVQHAHQKGVIHRDLKPSNILVTLHDGVPVPKIIDFGIAKAMDRQLTDKTLVTQFHAFVGTPVYTSPEQMEMSGLDVDTRSDIYSLGVLLYELLAGRPPFDPDALLKSGLETMRRTIREVDPPRPSHQLGTLSEQDRTSVAQQRGTEPGKLSLLLRGDLDWIVMRCLEKDRTRRYATASGLAADIERHLRDDLVVARPPSRVYQVQKFVRRHKLAVAATAAVAASLIAGLVASSALLVRERAAHGRAMMAERQEADLRRQAETVRAEEVKRAARTALDLANRSLADGKVADGLAYLVYAARKDPQNAALAPRLASALASHNFLLPEGAPLECGSRVLAVRFTRDGKSLYVGTEVGTFRVFDASSGELKREFHLGHRVALGGWEFARDNDRLFAAHLANHTLGVFETDSGRSRWTPGALDPNVLPYTEYVGNGHSAGLSPDGRWVYALAQDRFWLWDAATGAVCLQLVPGQQIAGSDITADGRQLAVTVGGVVKRWTLTNAGPVAVPDPPGNPAITNGRTVSFSPDGRQLAVSGFLTGVRLVDVSTGALLRTLPWAEDVLDPASVKFASADRLFASGNRRSGSWNLTTGEFTTLPIAGGLDLVGTSVDATGRRVLAIGTDGFVRLCDLETGELVTEPAWRQHQVFCAALAPDGTHIVIGTAAGAVLRLRVGRGAARPLVLPRMLSAPMPAPFLPDPPTRLLWMTGNRARALDVASGQEVAGGFAYPEPVLPMGGIDFNPPVRPDLKFMVVDTAHGCQAWELGAGGVIHVAKLEGAPAGGGPPIFSPRGDLVARCFHDDLKLGIWNMRTGAPAGPGFFHPNLVINLTPSFNPDGRLIAFGTTDGAGMIIDVATARPVVTFATRPLVPNQTVGFSPDGSRVVTSNIQYETRLWNAATGEPISPMLDTTDAIGFARYSPDGSWFATWGRHSTSLWDGQTGAPTGESIPAAGKQVRFSRDSRCLGTADENGIVRVWDVPSGQPWTEPMRYSPIRVFSPEFSPDGRFLRVEKENFYVWSVPRRLPEGTPTPEWLLQLATVCATKTVNDAGQLVDLPDAMTQFDVVRRQIAALPADAPLAEWGRWVLADGATRSIAPGFTITPPEAAKLAAEMAPSTTTP